MTEIIKTDGRWQVKGSLCLADVEELLAAGASISGVSTLEIDMAEVVEVETVALSLLFEWMRQAASCGCRLTYTNLPANLTSLALLYGVLELIPQTADVAAAH